MSKKYIKCDGCGKKIYFGDTVYNYDGFWGTYCSTECFTYAYGEEVELTEEHALGCMCIIYDDGERKAEIKAQIEKLQDELAKLEKE